MDDICQSQRKAAVAQKWIFGERLNRIGDPFQWVDGSQLSHLNDVNGSLKVLQYLSMSGEIYETPETIRTSDHQEVLARIEGRLQEAYNYFVPFRDSRSYGFQHYIQSTATVKLQDYCFIRTFCNNLPIPGSKHLDIGPGLGANAIFSVDVLGSQYYPLEAFPHSYSVQRMFFRFLCGTRPTYLDLVECENFGLVDHEIRSLLNHHSGYSIKHVPSWHAALIEDESIDLATATWVLNEVNPAGISWLMVNIDRVLKPGGYFYIRDSERRKPLRHDLDYDQVLVDMGYVRVGRLDIRNRIDMHGIPRAYQKHHSEPVEFEAFFERHFGRFSVTAHGGDYVQNQCRSNNQSASA